MSNANGLFLGVESSATGRAWRSRLDERGSARALAIAQRHELPELLARILAGRNVELDAVEAFLDPTVRAAARCALTAQSPAALVHGDGVEAPPGSRRVLPPAGAVGDGKGPEWAVRKRRGPSRVVGKPAP